MRGGVAVVVPTYEVVPGDLVELKTGDTVPADIRSVQNRYEEIASVLTTVGSLRLSTLKQMRLC